MKRLLCKFAVLLLLVVPALNLATATPAGAYDIFGNICNGNNDTKTNASGTDVCKDKSASQASKQNPIIHAISIAISVLAFVIGVSAVIMIIVNGFRIITSQGDPQSMASARTAIIYALVGLAVAIVAGSIVALVLNNL